MTTDFLLNALIFLAAAGLIVPVFKRLGLGEVGVKAMAMLVAARLYRNHWKEATNLAVLLSQGGEFGFVLLSAAATAALLDQGLVSLLILVISLSMATTPLLYQLQVHGVRRLFE